MKKVAATRGQRVRRTNFLRLGTTARGWEFSSCCRLPVANFYGCLLKRLTLTTASPLCLRMKTCFSRLPGSCVFPGISAKLVRKCEITGIFHRCKNFLEILQIFVTRQEEYEGNEYRVAGNEGGELNPRDRSSAHRNFPESLATCIIPK